jgi:uncharacterized protein (DUF2267 family)
VAKTNEWLHVLESSLGTDDADRAYAVLRAVLHALRDRVGPETAAHVSAQLPLLVRGVFFERWDPTHTPSKLSREEFVELVERNANLKGTTESEDAIRAVFALMWNELGTGTMSKVIAVLPDDYATLY